MDTQLVTEFMSQHNNVMDNVQSISLLDSDSVCSNIAVPSNVVPTASVPSNVVPSNVVPNNRPQIVTKSAPAQTQTALKNTSLTQIPKNLNTNRINQNQNTNRTNNINQNTTRHVNFQTNRSQTGRSHTSSNHQNTRPQTGDSQVALDSSDYYSLFGFQLSKTTVYIIIAFIAIIIIYYLYKYFTSPGTKNKPKRKQEVSFNDQADSQNNGRESQDKEEEDDDDEKK